MKKLVILLIIIFMYSCREKELELEEVSLMNKSKAGMKLIDYRGQRLSVWKNEEGNYILGDDMVLNCNDVKELDFLIVEDINAKSANWDHTTKLQINLWPTNELTYRIAEDIPSHQKILIREAIDEWNSKTILNFTEVLEGEGVYFKKVVSGCFADLGYFGKKRSMVSVSETCDKQSIIHEIGHIVGMIHEHQREIRDEAITLQLETFDYIKNYYPLFYKTILYNLEKERSNLTDPCLFDMNSAMMYGSYPRNNISLMNDLISRNLPFYTKKDGSLVERPTYGLTQKDITWVHYQYNKKIILKNVDYPGVYLKVRLEGASDPSIVLFSPGHEAIFTYNTSKKKYEYGDSGYIVQEIDLSNGSRSDVIDFSWSTHPNSITYLGNDGETKVLISDYNDSSNSKYYHFTDNNGVGGENENAIIEAIKKDDRNTYINLKRWKTNISTDGKRHAFDKNEVTELIVRNIDYPTLNSVLMRLEHCIDPKISLAPGQSVGIKYHGSGDYFEYNGCKLQEIDFNNGSSSDNLDFSWAVPGKITYTASHHYTTTLIDTNSLKGYIYGTVDVDGIDGQDSNVQLDAYFSNGKMYIDIKR
ncbi:M12 family metallopeptidase [Chryseobacterium potabilaquae]|uniref:Flavastacin n=1 Tax=Chryseobacterium potabilaquae TaxID=2675057 RepID=A0A6N4XE94_9FLAO|nr:M12 family metallopeptidase [Chryseobacterium potabilaquae]CAA7197280.1 Flavastacin [Chryseobacterium potabilaquae]